MFLPIVKWFVPWFVPIVPKESNEKKCNIINMLDASMSACSMFQSDNTVAEMLIDARIAN